MNYKDKYLKYKHKYINLKKLQKAGVNNIKLNAYVIHLKGHDERRANIEEERKKLGNIPLQIFDAVVGADLDINKIVKEHDYKSGVEIRTTGEIGCFLSHRNLLEKIKNTEKSNGYSIIFEDDFKINSNNFEEDINKIINNLKNKNLDFDMIYLGNSYVFNNHGENIIENIHKVDKNTQLYCLQGLLINNSKIDKILSCIQRISKPIDVIYNEAIINDKISTYVIFPFLVEQQEFSIKSSSIRDQYNKKKNNMNQFLLSLFNNNLLI
jgi:GR25 family glycosyltransferase involved in LPS biosynthesis